MSPNKKLTYIQTLLLKLHISEGLLQISRKTANSKFSPRKLELEGPLTLNLRIVISSCILGSTHIQTDRHTYIHTYIKIGTGKVTPEKLNSKFLNIHVINVEKMQVTWKIKFGSKSKKWTMKEADWLRRSPLWACKTYQRPIVFSWMVNRNLFK